MTFDINSFKLHLQDVSQHIEQDYTEPIRLDNTRAQLSIQEAYRAGYRQALNEKTVGIAGGINGTKTTTIIE